MFERSQRIAELNDKLRTTLKGGQIVKTPGINALPVKDQIQILNLISTFDNFSEENDPYGEHDFGSIELNGNKIYWKIDYYDRKMEGGSDDPADPEKTTRVLTVMLNSEY